MLIVPDCFFILLIRSTESKKVPGCKKNRGTIDRTPIPFDMFD